MGSLADRVAAALGVSVTRCTPLGAGATGSVSLIQLADGSCVVAKVASAARGAERDGLLIEARSLRLLEERSALPVPRVLHADRDLLVMDHKVGRSKFDDGAEKSAAEILAALHALRSSDGRYGLEFDALIGPLHQPNGWDTSWVAFWRGRRVMEMARHARDERVLPPALVARLEQLAERLGDLIPDRPVSSLVHGDVWSGNVLAMRDGSGSRISAFLDPAPYYAHHEVELAFITLFSTFGRAFFDRYSEVGTPVAPEFWSVRRHVYNTYPLLVHVRLYGGGYVGELDRTMGMLGF